MKKARNMRSTVDSLLDDVLVDIFSYLPARRQFLGSSLASQTMGIFFHDPMAVP
jgi:hypothetical protein